MKEALLDITIGIAIVYLFRFYLNRWETKLSQPPKNAQIVKVFKLAKYVGYADLIFFSICLSAAIRQIVNKQIISISDLIIPFVGFLIFIGLGVYLVWQYKINQLWILPDCFIQRTASGKTTEIKFEEIKEAVFSTTSNQLKIYSYEAKIKCHAQSRNYIQVEKIVVSVLKKIGNEISVK